MRILLDPCFLDACLKLDKKIQKKTDAAIKKVNEAPSRKGANFEKLGGYTEDIFSVRVDDNFRILLRRLDGKGAIYIAFDVAKHEVIYRR